ncbi:hypothetical protein BJX62DRAFT_215636 [Aspergillus germanicus]
MFFSSPCGGVWSGLFLYICQEARRRTSLGPRCRTDRSLNQLWSPPPLLLDQPWNRLLVVLILFQALCTAEQLPPNLAE